MKLKPIKNDRELNRALKRIDELWGAKPNTPRGDELDVLMLIVEKYEDEHYAIPASDPIRGDQVLDGAEQLVAQGPGALYRDKWSCVRGAE